MTETEYSKIIQPIFDDKNLLREDGKFSYEVNYKYLGDKITAYFARDIWNNPYI